MEIEVKGHSGCSIDIVRKGKQLLIAKGTRDPKYVERLYQQALKQQKAQSAKLQFIRIPEILNITKSDTEMVMEMEYVYSKNFVDYFENAGFEQVNYFVKAIDIFIQSEIERSQMQDVPVSIILDKFADVKHKTLNNPFMDGRDEVMDIISRSEKVFTSLPATLTIPVGVCHGDLTFSNILFNGNNYFLIDFLDSFIESPLCDMVKMRQDTAHRWSPLMYEGEYDKTRFNIIAEKIDQELHTLFSRYEWYVRYYDAFQLMNLLRVLQYGHEDKVVQYLVEVLTQLLDSIDNVEAATPSPFSLLPSEITPSPSSLLPSPSENTSSPFSLLSSPSDRTIIVPIAADKPEYDTILPHVFRMNNNGVMLCIAGLTGINLDDVDHIYFTILRKHSQHYRLRDMMQVQFDRLGLTGKAEVVELDAPTTSQPETVLKTIVAKNITGSLLIKDADCYFEATLSPENSVFTYPLDSMSQVNPQGKSYIQTDDMYYITNIIERRIIGRDFCAGGYYFEDVNDFLKYYSQNRQYHPLYMSHIIYSALLDGLPFRPVKVKAYKDWGTRIDWTRNE